MAFFHAAIPTHWLPVVLVDTAGITEKTEDPIEQLGIERSRAALAQADLALLVVDAVQGVQAQTLANVHLAIERNLEILPVINKIDLPAAQPEDVATEVENLTGIPAEDVVPISAKTGENVFKLWYHIYQ